MATELADLTALSYNVDSIGKLFSDTKQRHTWTLDIGGETAVVVVTASWNSGKFVVELNGYERFHQTIADLFVYSFKFKDRYFKIHSKGEKLALLIDAVPFESYSAKSKAAQAALLKSYEKNTKDQSSPSLPEVIRVPKVPRVPRVDHEPFSGDLAKRLGKKTDQAEGYIPQADVEDLFAVPVKVQSFVTPEMSTVTPADLTVIPNLIEFGEVSEEDNKPVVSPTGLVTPRDQISPDHLVNPFSAFDELVVPDVVEDNPFKSD